MNKPLSQTAQMVMDGMPERTPLGEAAIEYLNAKAAVKAAEEAKNDQLKVLVEEFKRSGLSRIKVAGHQFFYEHKEKDTVAIEAL